MLPAIHLEDPSVVVVVVVVLPLVGVAQQTWINRNADEKKKSEFNYFLAGVASDPPGRPVRSARDQEAQPRPAAEDQALL